MADTNNAQQKEVKVEDLLRLKRAERPNQAFWNTFDRELHQRMLQTLVKKDPWYVQLLRGVSGRIAQTTAVGAAAAFLALMVVRPALVESTQVGNDAVFAQQSAETISNAPIEVVMSDLDASLDSGMIADYQIEAISSSSIDSTYTKEYSLDSFEVASYGSDAYVMDSATFIGMGLATASVY